MPGPFLSRSLFLLCLIFLGSVVAQEEFDWSSIEPNTNISWVDCFSELQCARFQVPFNHSNPDDGKTFAIAMVKLPAKVGVDDASYRGPIFVNPGGPGGSGVDEVLQMGNQLQAVAGAQFDIIGFDPRGVGFTTPPLSIFQSPEERQNWVLREILDMNSTEEAIPVTLARYQVFGQLAQTRDNEGILSFVSTDNVARDMLAMAEALGQVKVQYYGLSYGTALGAVFATMFPDRVGRLIIDGVLDMDGWFGNDLAPLLVDADKAMQTFFDGCHSAGPDACAFFESSPSEIASKLDSLYASLRAQPLPVFSGDTYGIVTLDALRTVVFFAIASPYDQFSGLASELAQLVSGNGTAIYQAYTATRDAIGSELDSLVAIECSDADPLNKNASELKEYMLGINSTFAGPVVTLMARCAGWNVHPESRFKGPVGGNTSFPLLVIGNTADPRTPLAAAKKTSLAFPGSVLLTQDSPGHTSTVANSSCTHQHIAAYFVNGTLPEEGTICQVDGSQLFP